jgi:mRNA-degrading endonuclease toxin of MazEF toxin-antitoxin module
VSSSDSPINRGAVCWGTVPAGFGHDQGTRPWLVLAMSGLDRVIAVPVSSDRPQYGFPLSWPVPATWGLERPSWLRVDYVRSLPADRLRFVTGSTDRERIYDGYPDIALDMVASRTFDGRIQLLEYVPTVLTSPPGVHPVS